VSNNGNSNNGNSNSTNGTGNGNGNGKAAPPLNPFETLSDGDEEIKLDRSEMRAPPGPGRMGAAGMPAEKSKDFGASTKRLLNRMREERIGFVAVLVLALVSVFFAVLGPKILGHGTDLIFKGIRSGNGIDFHALHNTLLLVLAMYVASSVLQYIQSFVLAGIVQRTMQRMRRDVEDKLNRVPLSYIDRQPRGDLLSRSPTTSTTSPKACSRP